MPTCFGFKSWRVSNQSTWTCLRFALSLCTKVYKSTFIKPPFWIQSYFLTCSSHLYQRISLNFHHITNWTQLTRASQIPTFPPNQVSTEMSHTLEEKNIHNKQLGMLIDFVRVIKKSHIIINQNHHHQKTKNNTSNKKHNRNFQTNFPPFFVSVVSTERPLWENTLLADAKCLGLLRRKKMKPTGMSMGSISNGIRDPIINPGIIPRCSM